MNTQKRIENNEDLVYLATDQDGNYCAAIAASFSPDVVADNVSNWLREGYNVDRVKRNKVNLKRIMIISGK